MYDTTVISWRIAWCLIQRHYFTTFRLQDSFTIWWITGIPVAWLLPISHKLRRSYIFFLFHSPSCRLWVLYSSFFFLEFLFFSFFAWRCSDLRMKVRLAIMRTAATDLVMVATQRFFTSWSTSRDTATGSMVSFFCNASWGCHTQNSQFLHWT